MTLVLRAMTQLALVPLLQRRVGADAVWLLTVMALDSPGPSQVESRGT